MSLNKNSQRRSGGASSTSRSKTKQEDRMPQWMKAGYWRAKGEIAAGRALADERATHGEENLRMVVNA